jgi:hypothetical protein
VAALCSRVPAVYRALNWRSIGHLECFLRSAESAGHKVPHASVWDLLTDRAHEAAADVNRESLVGVN